MYYHFAGEMRTGKGSTRYYFRICSHTVQITAVSSRLCLNKETFSFRLHSFNNLSKVQILIDTSLYNICRKIVYFSQIDSFIYLSIINMKIGLPAQPNQQDSKVSVPSIKV